MAAQGDQRGGADVHRVGAQGDGLDHVGAAADAAGGDERGPVADALLAQALVHRGEGQLDGDAHVVADDLRRRAGAAAEAVEGHDVGAGAHDAAGDGGDVVHRGDLHADRLRSRSPP